MFEKLFTETFFKKSNYFRKELNLTSKRINGIKDGINNWTKHCETFTKKIDKESSVESEFVKSVFETMLGYQGIAQNASEYNIISKFTIPYAGTSNNSGYADLVLGYFKKNRVGLSGNAQVLVEFKDQSSNDLDKPSHRKDKFSPVDQCWNYLNTYPQAKWGLITNFNEIRLYYRDIGKSKCARFYFVVPDDLKDKFNPLFEETELLKFLFILSKINLLSQTGKSVSEDILNKQGIEESTIQKKFYFQYKNLRKTIFNNALKHNPVYDKIEKSKNKVYLLSLVQKFLDRVIFCWFCEDSREHLLPSNVLTEIIDVGIRSKYYTKSGFNIWSNVKELFSAINNGGNFNITQGYNGGLFAEDIGLDTLKIPNNIFEEISAIGKQYDFGDGNELNVNILGHIFEQSISDLEEFKGDITGNKQEKKYSKRKKDGVYYTPEYITSYIVKETIGKWLTDKYKEVEKKYSKRKKSRQKTILIDYRDNYLKKMKILDPACGSGAFLISAFNYLWMEHRRIYNELKAIQGKEIETFLFDFDEVDKSILENNLYGVDLNEESVEITKLSLWLKTACRNKQLNNLDDNIKCGNSLIDDENIAGKKAFNWNNNFPFKFDVIIGNPPYVRAELLDFCRDYLAAKYEVFNSNGDMFSYFYEKSLKLLNPNGLFGFISNTFDKTTAGITMRGYLQNEICFLKYIDLKDVNVFEGTITYPIIIIAQNKKLSDLPFEYIKIPKTSQGNVIDIKFHEIILVKQHSLDKKNWIFKSNKAVGLINKLKINKTIKTIYGKSYRGILTGLNEAFIIPKKFLIGEHIKPIYEGKDLKKWIAPISNQQLILFKGKWTKEIYGNDILETEAIKKLNMKFPDLFNQILPFEEKAKKRYDKGDFFWELRNCAYYDLFEKPKIVFPNLQNSNKFSFDETGAYINAPAVMLPTNDKFLVGILNSNVVWYFLKSICIVRSGGYIEVKPQYFEQIPIPELTSEQKKYLLVLINLVIELTNKKHQIQNNFLNLLLNKFNGIKITNKIKEWYNISFPFFYKELKKQEVILTLPKESEWIELFEEKSTLYMNNLHKIFEVQRNINTAVYGYYKLESDEIIDIENSI